MGNFSITATQHSELHDYTEAFLVPKRAIKKVVRFLGFQMISGRLDIESFDQITNTLIRVCNGDSDLQFEIVEVKRKMKSLLAQILL